MSQATSESTSPELPALAPPKDGARALRVSADRVRRVRVSTPPALTDQDRERVTFALDAMADTASRVLVVLVRSDGFTIADAAATIGMTVLSAAERLRSAELIARQKMAFAARPAQEDDVPRAGNDRPAGVRPNKPAGLPRNSNKRRRE